MTKEERRDLLREFRKILVFLERFQPDCIEILMYRPGAVAERQRTLVCYLKYPS